ncbi:PREDICTED: centriole, cilia and spindle-associated protein [Hipposideros armiger]|uniref:Centriole, cilia and spindle-associated protein n=1 Tax=Hipposideros armiger TaxID=186990 RepID=A0A8B7PZB6_HIPAR|nr:PREDICTED: centriole, cilia and spindle-associated protein [Hipposideros armiger]
MSPGSGVKSEYMKRYREPRWDEYAPCYRELLHYRLGRRLLEQAHAPWLWDDWGPAGASDDSASSASSGAGSPAPQCARDSPPPPPPAELGARQGQERMARGAPEEPAGDTEAGDAEAGDTEDTSLPALSLEFLHCCRRPLRNSGWRVPLSVLGPLCFLPTHSSEGAHPRAAVVCRRSSGWKMARGQQQGALFARGAGKAVRSPQRSSSKTKEKKRPFALYGWGEKQMNTGSQRTHNVLVSAPLSEIHESALRAKNRRQVEKRKLAAQRQRAHSDDVEKSRRTKPLSSENPWMTEYMRCYSARA